VSALPVSAIGALAPDDLVPGDLVQGTAGAPAPGASFADMVARGVAEVDTKLKAGEAGLQRLATGDVENLQQVMIRLEESRLSFQLMMQVRNRLLEAYQDVMKMQV
jgi:flagellar hook-basal body complex protein FliE